jgi:hypothetical protein
MILTIHIGPGKTGTSSIQSFLKRNQDLLLKEKILYTRNFDNIGVENLFVDWIKDENQLIEILDHLNKFLLKHEIEHFIWSWESLSSLKIDLIKIIKSKIEYEEVNIVTFLRRQDAWFESGFYQWGWKHKTYQGNYLIDFEKYYVLRKEKGNYLEKLDNWSNVFGQENMIVQPFEETQLKDGLINTFVRLINLESVNLDTTELHIYKNIGHYPTQIIGICNSVYEKANLNTPLINLLNRIQRKQEVVTNAQLISNKRRLEIIHDFESINKKIAEKYLNRPSGELFFDPLPDPNEEWIPYDEISFHNTIPILMELFLMQQNEINKLKQQLNRIENKTTKENRFITFFKKIIPSING